MIHVYRDIRRTLLSFGVCAAVLSATAGCAGILGPNGAPVDEWVGDVCGALAGWQRDIEIERTEMMQAAAPDLGADGGSPHDPRLLGQDDLANWRDAGRDRVRRPACCRGRRGDRSNPSRGALGVRAHPLRARAMVDELPHDPQVIAEGAQEIGNSINEEFDRIGARLEASLIDPGRKSPALLTKTPRARKPGWTDSRLRRGSVEYVDVSLRGWASSTTLARSRKFCQFRAFLTTCCGGSRASQPAIWAAP